MISICVCYITSYDQNVVVEENDAEFGERAKTGQVKEAKILEPYVGMEFESEADGRNYYNEYATRVGFVVRLVQPRRSETDGGPPTRCLVCNKHGLSLSLSPRSGSGPEKRRGPVHVMGATPPYFSSGRNLESGSLLNSKKEHNHPLEHDHNLSILSNLNLRDKDKKIHKLTGELQRQEEEFAAYRERFMSLVADIEKQADRHLSPNVIAVVQSVRKAEAEALHVSRLLST